MKENPRFIIIAVQSVIIAFLLVYLVFTIDDSDEPLMHENLLSELQERYKTCKERNDSLSMLVQEFRTTGAIPPLLDKSQVDELIKRGLNDPVEELRDDLMTAGGLIGSSGVLGGEMGFYFRDGIHVLNNKWVLAYFEDGHIAGALLLRYEVGLDGEILWEVIDEVIY